MLDTIKRLLGINGNDQDDLLESIISLTEARLQSLLGSSESVPSQLKYIVTEVSISRFNRIGSEGASSHNVEGESLSFVDDDFAPYLKDIEAYLDDPWRKRVPGGFKFL